MDNDGTDNVIGRTIKRLVSCSEEDVKRWLKQGDEIERYCTSDDYSFIYQDFNEELSFKARVNKAAEFTQILGPYLYPNNPDATVLSEDWTDQWTKERHKLEEKYADYSARHGRLDVDMRRAVDHSLVYGRAPLWCGFDTRKKIVRHVFDRSDKYLVDPDARVLEERNWEARKRIKPRWELIALYPDQKAVIERLPVYTRPKTEKNSSGEPSSDLVCYNECWFGVGVENYVKSAEVAEMDQVNVGAKKKYCVADGHILSEADWEIPFFLIDEWPSTCLDLLEMPGSLYPKQPMEPGMGHLRAMNWIYTLFIAKTRLMSRTPFARMTINGQTIEADQLHKILRGEQMDILNVVVNGTDLEGVDINKLFQRIDWGDPVPGFDRAWSIIGNEFEKSTGLAEILYSGQTNTQIRTAAAANLMETNSKTRVEAFRETTAKFLGRVFQKTLFAARFLHDQEDIGSLFGQQAGAIWGVLGPPESVAQESQMRGQITQNIMAKGGSPDLAEQMMGPPQFVSMDTWINEADRSIDGGSMRRIDHEAQQNNLNVGLNQLGPAVVNLPGGGKFVASLAAEYAKLNRFSPELVAAANNISTEIDMMQQAQMMAPPPEPSPKKGPKGPPQGGTPTVQ